MAADPHIRGYYLSADVAHDFGPGVLNSTPYNHGGPNANTRLPETPKIEEDAAVDYIEEKAKNKNGTEFIENGSARRSKRIIFTIPTKTAVFNASSVPTLFEGGNNAIGIIQDAGSFITGYLGAKNVITFGSILDPAGKPISQSDAPIWYQPPDGAFAEIPLGPFGFDTTKIQGTSVLGMTAGLVSSTFTLGDGTVLDAVTMNRYNPQTPGRKPINTTKIESSGFYTSIAKAEEAAKNPAAREVVRNNYGYLFNIGKTLGDAALVASAMPSFRSNDERQLLPNPLYGVGTPTARDRDSPGWHDWISGEPVQGPSILMLKTGDRLNALRAQMENVPNILEQQAGKGRSVKQYLFTPGKADPNAILAAVNQGYVNLKANVAGRYTTLIQNFNKCLQPDVSLNPLYTIFTETPTIKSTDREGLVLAGRFIELLTIDLTALKNGILDWLDTRSAFVPTTLDELEIFQTNYNSDVETCTRVAPQTTDVVYTKQGVTKITLKIIVSQLPKVIPEGYTCPLRVSLDISLWNAFKKLERNGGGKGLRAIIGTDVYNRFMVPISSLVGIPDELKGGDVQRGGGDEDMLLNEFVNYVSRSPNDDAVMTGGAPVSVDDSNLISRYSPTEFEIEFPLVSLFGKYVSENLNVQDFKQTLIAIYDVSLNRGGQTTIVDDTFLDEFMKEAERLTLQDPPLVSFSGGQAARGHTTSGTAAFNAFTYYINRMNTVDSGFIGRLPVEPDESTQIVSGNENTPPTFLVLERLFLEKAKLYMKDTRTQSYFNTSSIQKGGRRPLYAPRRKTYRRKPRSKKTRKQ
jgi:hypothetical protein